MIFVLLLNFNLDLGLLGCGLTKMQASLQTSKAEHSKFDGKVQTLIVGP